MIPLPSSELFQKFIRFGGGRLPFLIGCLDLPLKTLGLSKIHFTAPSSSFSSTLIWKLSWCVAPTSTCALWCVISGNFHKRKSFSQFRVLLIFCILPGSFVLIQTSLDILYSHGLVCFKGTAIQLGKIDKNQRRDISNILNWPTSLPANIPTLLMFKRTHALSIWETTTGYFSLVLYLAARK